MTPSTTMVGLLGGSFDPVHYGHIRIAEQIFAQLPLAEVRFIPNRVPPHRAPGLASVEHRVAMLQAALLDYPQFRLDRTELNREGPSYMVDTLAQLKQSLGSTTLIFILGRDAFNQLDQWHRWQSLLDYCHLVVANRPGEVSTMSAALEQYVQSRVVDESKALEKKQAGYIMNCPVDEQAISSTQIRDLIKHDLSVNDYLPEPVARYIEQHALYR